MPAVFMKDQLTSGQCSSCLRKVFQCLREREITQISKKVNFKENFGKMMFFLGDLDKSMLSLWNSGGRIADVSATNIPNGEEQWDTCRPQFSVPVLYF